MIRKFTDYFGEKYNLDAYKRKKEKERKNL